MVFINSERFNKVLKGQLGLGMHNNAEQGMCAMEAVSYITEEAWSDTPACVDPLIARIMRRWNDALEDEERSRVLLPYLTMVVGTGEAGKPTKIARLFKSLEWTVKSLLPLWMEEAGAPEEAQMLQETSLGVMTLANARSIASTACQSITQAMDGLRAKTTPLSICGRAEIVDVAKSLERLSEVATRSGHVEMEGASVSCLRLAIDKSVYDKLARSERETSWYTRSELLKAEFSPLRERLNRITGHLIEALCFAE